MNFESQKLEKMDRSSSCDDNSELECHPFSQEQIDRSNTDIGYSTLSAESFDFSRTISDISSYSEPSEGHNTSDEHPSPGWPIAKFVPQSPAILKKLAMKQRCYVLDEKLDDAEAFDSGLEIMKERFSKLLLGEDMSGGGRGVNTAVAISNAITNLYATVFGQFGKLEPLSPGKKSMWTREMDCLLSVCNYIVEFVPSLQTLPSGNTLEVMTSRPRADIDINLPALQKLDTMLLEILESFHDTEYWYIDEGTISPHANILGSFGRVIHQNAEKWWLPVPCVPPCGLSENSRKQMQHKRESTNQIYKAAMAINSSILSEMGVPETYLVGLPKSGRASVGDSVYRYMSTADQFSPDHLLDCLAIKSEHEALEIADRVEASMYVWRRKASMQYAKSSWVKDLMVDGDKNETLASRAENLLLCLKQRYPGLSQTTLDTCRIQYNKDVGQAILESYSRVLESLAFNIVARIDDLLHIDGSVKRTCSVNSLPVEPQS